MEGKLSYASVLRSPSSSSSSSTSTFNNTSKNIKNNNNIKINSSNNNNKIRNYKNINYNTQKKLEKNGLEITGLPYIAVSSSERQFLSQIPPHMQHYGCECMIIWKEHYYVVFDSSFSRSIVAIAAYDKTNKMIGFIPKASDSIKDIEIDYQKKVFYFFSTRSTLIIKWSELHPSQWLPGPYSGSLSSSVSSFIWSSKPHSRVEHNLAMTLNIINVFYIPFFEDLSWEDIINLTLVDYSTSAATKKYINKHFTFDIRKKHWDASDYWYSPCRLKVYDINELAKLNKDQLTCITHVYFSNEFDSPLINIPNLPSLTHLFLGDKFNRPIKNLPSTITHLSFADYFNNRIDFPPNLKHLTISSNFRQPLGQLPPTLTHFRIHNYHKFAPKITDPFPHSITHLSIDYLEPGIKSSEYPPNLTYFYTILGPNQTLSNLPASITHLRVDDTIHTRELPQDRLSKLTHLFVEEATFKASLPLLIPNLTHLTFGMHFNAKVDGILPSTITHLNFGTGLLTGYSAFNQTVDNLPPSLVQLTFPLFSIDFCQGIDHLPPSLKYLQLNYSFNLPVDHLPPSLTHLIFGSKFNQKIDRLPNSITHLMFTSCSKFNQFVDKLPSSLKEIVLPRKHRQYKETQFSFGFFKKQDVFYCGTKEYIL